MNTNLELLRVSGLQKGFGALGGTRHCIVDVPEFRLAAGEQLALSGESGSGKTTFLNLIAGIIKPDAGSVWFDGKDISSLSESRRDLFRAQNIGYIFQTFNLLQGYSCLENVLLGMSFGHGADRAFAAELLQRVGLGDRLHHRPGQLSTGQQQRVAVARALANRPKLVLADEPTGNLDGKNSRVALALIRDSCRAAGAALLLVSHDPAVLGQFDEVRNFHEVNRAVVEEAVA
ncbi:MAG TPA: ABC transporter ATP-binding protein [Verrucomicrobiae bacterium]|nr:ABC transporter ATP-binding protein [Verrucomicrobiae bacterium]